VRLQAGNRSASHISDVVRLEALRTIVHHPHRRIELDLWQQDTAAVTETQGRAPSQDDGMQCTNTALRTYSSMVCTEHRATSHFLHNSRPNNQSTARVADPTALPTCNYREAGSWTPHHGS
jgi:hypothetical protein